MIGTPETFSYFLLLVCGHKVEHREYAGVDPEESWHPGDGRWCFVCDRNSTVAHVLDFSSDPLAGRS